MFFFFSEARAEARVEEEAESKRRDNGWRGDDRRSRTELILFTSNISAWREIRIRLARDILPVQHTLARRQKEKEGVFSWG